MIRRLHDIDRHGCFVLMFLLIPYAGTVIMFIMLGRKSAPFDTYPGRSGSGPYTQQNPYAYPPPPQHPYGQPQYPYAAPGRPQAPPGQPQNPYAPPGQPQNPYVPPGRPQYPYAQPPAYYRPLPPPREFAPKSGGDKALLAIILSIAVTIGSSAYGFVINDYMQKNMDRFISTVFSNMLPDYFGDYFGDFFDNPYNWDGIDPWSGEIPRDEDEFWEEAPRYSPDAEGQMTEDEIAAIDLVRESALEGFPEFTVEEVLRTRVEEYSLEWGCFSEEGEGRLAYYVYASGVVIGSFLSIYAGFDVYDDGVIELFSLGDGERDEYNEDALGLYAEWYEAMLSGIDNTAL